ncbi:hypothetical protein EHI8A_199920 [Entamoeba histolytica HM-1:IMSS-B]|uniref:Uncharacterized protein n=6 Tax=Entamoeba histolytica TaxID=5759 RepID=C4LX26_ENTH1|nr:hypothetical protein EHI_087610 [Entamoeba histolytica HM-1:IMSS]XP_653271.1 hypothetical protein EHI_159330 [Entamoeba histolytica HM-1:IMSS]EMD44100.1 prp4, putative [Entamoeba histolytica KU27]EMH73496.1 hypothetical protein EHI8A_199920 [Entamoeba histolytica HM-1:IMSS-B]EMS12179.1 prp4, putative [Entamoeba histolytica HM-3:IMSS]ENY63825.1 prp4, putative [Entamoeba histolytica HM-1:IMSS-A]GAT93278.1 hypothetical protein CL6EHI_159330 [Entamoeba histolytica]|eukprot:XP_651353.1 hypothetical protein EHI_087610 [Entamoeba histolytica HM-1:IMSS]
MSGEEIKVYTIEELFKLRENKFNFNITLTKKVKTKKLSKKKGQQESTSPAEFFERYRWIMHEVILIEKEKQTKMHGSYLYSLFLQGKLNLHECTVKSQDPTIPFILQLKKYIDIYKKILDIDKAKEEEKLKQKMEEMNKPKAAEPIYKEQTNEELFDPLAGLDE